MKLVLSLALLAAAPALSAAAPEAPAPVPSQSRADAGPPSIERQMLARRYVSLAVSPDQFIAGMRAMAANGVAKMMLASGDDSEPAQVDRYMQRFFLLLDPKIRERLPNVMEAYAQAYAREFSADELKQLVAFAQSPAGRHYLAGRGVMESDPAVQLQEQGIAAEIQPIVNQLEKEKCQARTAQRIAAGDKKAKCSLADKPDTAAG